MPRPVPPAPAAARRRTTPPSAHSRPATARAAGTSAAPRTQLGPAAPAVAVPGWAFGGGAPTAAELDALWLNTDLLGSRDGHHLPTAADLAPLHEKAPAPTPARAEVTFTRLDDKGRLPLPLCPVVDTELVGERDGAVLVVFLPGATAAPRPGYEAPALRMDARRRLLLGSALRAQLGLPAGAAVIARAVPARGVLELMAASRVEPLLDGLFDAQRRTPGTTGAEAGASDGPPATDGGLGARRRLAAVPGGRLLASRLPGGDGTAPSRRLAPRPAPAPTDRTSA